MGIFCLSHLLQTPVVFYLICVLLRAPDEADHVDAVFCYISVASLVPARSHHYVAMTAYLDCSGHRMI